MLKILTLETINKRNLVIYSVVRIFFTIFARKFQMETVPDVKIERDIYETRNQKRPW